MITCVSNPNNVSSSSRRVFCSRSCLLWRLIHNVAIDGNSRGASWMSKLIKILFGLCNAADVNKMQHVGLQGSWNVFNLSKSDFQKFWELRRRPLISRLPAGALNRPRLDFNQTESYCVYLFIAFSPNIIIFSLETNSSVAGELIVRSFTSLLYERRNHFISFYSSRSSVTVKSDLIKIFRHKSY